MSPAPNPRPLVTVRELATELLGWKLTRTYEADRSGAIPGRVVVNGRILYRRRVVEAWLSGEATPTVHADEPPDPRGLRPARQA